MKSILSVLALTVLTSTAFARILVVDSETKNVKIIKEYTEGLVSAITLDIYHVDSGFDRIISCDNPSQELLSSVGIVSRTDGATHAILVDIEQNSTKLVLSYKIDYDQPIEILVPLNSECSVR